MDRFRCWQLMPSFFLILLFSQNGFSQTLFGQLVQLSERQELAKTKDAVSQSDAFQKRLFFNAPLQPGEQPINPSHLSPASGDSGQAPVQDKADNSRSLRSPTAPLVPLTAREKMAYGFRRTFLSPASYANTAFSAMLTQLTEKKQPQKDAGDLFADGLSRFAIKFATDSTKRIFVSGIYPVLFHQDPRYKPSGKKGFKARLLYAASRVFVTENDFGNLRPNYAQLGGTLTASALANIWERTTLDRNRIGVNPTFSRFARSTSFDVLTFIVFREFGPDIKRKLLRK